MTKDNGTGSYLSAWTIPSPEAEMCSPLKSLYGWQSQKKVLRVGLFKKKIVIKTYDKENKKPVIKASICNGEQVAGFKDIHTGKIEEVMLIRNQADLDEFKKMYGIDGEIEKEY